MARPLTSSSSSSSSSFTPPRLVDRRLWTNMIYGVLLMLHAGSIYALPVYLPLIRDKLHLTIGQGTALATLANAGVWLAVDLGWLFDTHGHRITVLVGAGMNAVGYTGLALMCSGHLTAHKGWAMFFAWLLGHGGGAYYFAALKTPAAALDPAHRGATMGFLICFFGLSSGFLTQVYRAFFEPNVVHMLTYLAIAPTLVGIGAVWGLVHRPYHAHNRHGPDGACAGCPATTVEQRVQWDRAQDALSVLLPRQLNRSLVYVIATALYIGVASVTEALTEVNRYVLPFWVGVLFLCIPYILIPGPGDEVLAADQVAQIRLEQLTEGAADVPLLASATVIEATPAVRSKATPTVVGRDVFPFLAAMQQVDFYLLAFVQLVVVGVGITLLDDINDVLQSRHAPGFATDNVKTALVAVFSVCNALGRIVFGWASDRSRFVRPVFLVASCVTMATSMGVLAVVSQSAALYVAVPIGGFAYGGFFATGPVITTDLFSMETFAQNWGVLGVFAGSGSLLCGLVAASLHDAVRDASAARSCDGEAACFRGTFVLFFFLCLVAAGVASGLAYRRHRARRTKTV